MTPTAAKGVLYFRSIKSRSVIRVRNQSFMRFGKIWMGFYGVFGRGVGLGVTLACLPALMAAADLAFSRQISNNGRYVPGAPLDVTVTFTYSGADNVLALGMVETLPAGWGYIAFHYQFQCGRRASGTRMGQCACVSVLVLLSDAGAVGRNR